MKIKDALNVSGRSVSWRDAEVLLAEVLQVDRAFLQAHGERGLSAAENARFEEFLARREENEPVAYITGHKEFYGRDFLCDARALIPRPETEGLIDLAKTYLSPAAQILELGTGCGNIAITLAHELRESIIIATDISPTALKLARENWQRLNCRANLTFVQADLFDAPLLKGRQFDLIIANLPYVPETWKNDPTAPADVIFYEPELALFAGPDGLDTYRRFFAQVGPYLRPSGRILIEIGENETDTLLKIIQAQLGSKQIKIHPDYAGLDRIVDILGD